MLWFSWRHWRQYLMCVERFLSPHVQEHMLLGTWLTGCGDSASFSCFWAQGGWRRSCCYAQVRQRKSGEVKRTLLWWSVASFCAHNVVLFFPPFFFCFDLSIVFSPSLFIPTLMASSPSALTRLPLCFSPSVSLCKQAEGQQLCPQAVSRHLVAMVYGALFAGLYVGLPWQGLFAILNVWQHCTDADDKHPTSRFDQWSSHWLEEMERTYSSIYQAQ